MLVFDARKWFVSTTMITMAMVMIDSTRVADGKLDGKIDLVIIPSSFWRPQHEVYKRSISTLPNYIEMGNDKVRVAVVNQAYDSARRRANMVDIDFPLSGNQSEFEKWVGNWVQHASGTQLTNHALKVCREQVFDFADNDRAKIVIIHVAWSVGLRDNVKAEVERVRKLGVRIYVAYGSDGGLVDDVLVWTTSARLFLVGLRAEMFRRSMEKMPEIMSAIVRDLCGFCRFDEQGSCNGKLYEGADPDYFGDNRVKCQLINPSEIACAKTNGSKEECDFECNRRWPWEKKSDVYDPDCDQFDVECGKMKRIGGQAPTHMENCPSEHDCNKSVCTTTIAMTTISTTTTTSSTTSSIATTAAKAQGGSTVSPEGLSVGVIAGIAVGVIAVLILLLVIIATVVVMKKRKNAREQKEKLDLKMEKDRRIKSASKSAVFVDDSIGSKTKGAQTSVVADISVALHADQSKKKSATGDVKSEKSTGVDGSKMAAKSQVSKMAESKSSVGDVDKKSSKMESSKKK